ncbi:unnamed protein product [Lymnaea stagnalis]|uniref:Cadherin domain-containing protein n=1 Tax=Lymnaea stagnalis TaxID=6523 RepID=A0AAV2I1B5_LYMST
MPTVVPGGANDERHRSKMTRDNSTNQGTTFSWGKMFTDNSWIFTVFCVLVTSSLVQLTSASGAAPTLTVTTADVTMDEEKPVGTTVNFAFSATDAESDTLTYSFLGSGASFLTYDSTTQLVTLSTKIDTDPNQNVVYNPILSVSDSTSSATATLTLTVVDINDHAPSCSPMVTYTSLVEGTTGTQYTLTCSDGDSSLNGNNVLNYTRFIGDGAKFSVDPTSGIISVTAAVDYEAQQSETLQIIVADQAVAELSVTVTVIVSITPVNDNVPTWSATFSTPYNFPESISVGTLLFTMSATDGDTDLGGTLTYSLADVQDDKSGTVTGLFSVDAISGRVTTLSKLDRDNGVSKYTFTIEATDGGTGPHVITSTVVVNIDNVNDNAPVFLSTPYSVKTVPETSAIVDEVIFTVSASDADSGTTTFKYSVNDVKLGGTLVSDWVFDATNIGQLKLNKVLDLDTAGTSAVHILELMVKDGGSPELTGTTSLTVSITAVNDFPPTIGSQTSSPVSVPEDTAIGTSVAEMKGSDQDLGAEGVLAYTIKSGNTNNAFAVDSSGQITVLSQLDRETLDTYVLVIEIKDSGAAPIKSVSGTMTVSITDVNDNQPTCTLYYQIVTLLESAAVNDVVAALTCNDKDLPTTLQYTVKTSADTFAFSPPTSNQMTLLKAVDYESPTQQYNVDVEVSDGTYTQTVKVRVNIGAVNEDTPTFAIHAPISIAEGVIANPIVRFTATDGDYSPHNIVTYEIFSVTNTGLSKFGIDTSTGDISLLSALDYEALPAADKTYVLLITSKDGGGLVGTGTLTVSVTDVNDNAPVCDYYTYSINVLENAASSTKDLGCSDPDGTVLTYTLTQTPSAPAFTNTDDTINIVSLDYETSPFYALTMVVVDSGSPKLTTTVYVYINVQNVNDGGPTFTTPTTATVSETISIGTSVADMDATDPDGTDPVFGNPQYSILSGDAVSQFYIDPSTGVITTRKALDYEKYASYSLVIQAKEKGGASSASVTQSIIVTDVNDEIPECPSQTFSITVPEDKPVDFLVTTFVCTDVDAAPALTYTITTGDTTLFKMDTNKLELKALLDFETAQSHDLEITVSDTVHTLIITGTITVGSVDEGPPVFDAAPYNVQVNEDEAVSSVILTVKAVDPDSALDANGQVKYSFSATYSNFVIDETSGKITLVQKLDRETAASHVLIVKSADATHTATGTVSVTVLDVNDNTPTFTSTSYSAAMQEPVTANTVLVTVTASDLDDAATDFGRFTYSLSGSSNFAIDSTGKITNTVQLLADTGSSSYVLHVTAIDNGNLAGARTGTTVVTITVTTVNQNSPVCASSATVTIQENQFSIGDVIATVSFTDADTGADGEVIISFETPQSKFSLTQNGKDGEVRLLQNLDFDAGDTTFAFNIKATDKGTPANTGTCTVAITVDDVNDNPPICTSIMNVHQTEGQTSIATLACSDGDVNSALSYTIISTSPSTITPSVSAAGVVSVTTALDYETGSTYAILIKVTDNGTPVKSTTVTVSLYVTDINDNDPTLTGTFTFTIAESQTASGTVLYTATASSNDGPTDTLTFSLSDTTYFDISSTTGEITLKGNAPDYETVTSPYTMILVVKDSQNPTSRTASQTMSVTITDVNDNNPVFNPTVYSATLLESAAVGSPAVTVTATDGDKSAAYNAITYSIFSGNTAGVWSINSNTGAITTSATLDYETAVAYSLVVKASDGSLSATVTCNIRITPVNEYDPVFSPASVAVTVDENLAYGTLITTVAATDLDHGNDGILTYSIGSGPFMIDSSTGKVTVTGDLNRESQTVYTITVLAVDKGTTPRTGTLTLTVNINDVNDNAPSCVPDSYVGSVLESATVGTNVASLSCTDADADPASLNNALTYSITTGDTGLFTVDGSGVVTIKSGATLDREATASYTLVVSVVDKATSGKLTSSATVSVIILDVNDNAPTFTPLPSPSVAENTALGTTIATVSDTISTIGPLLSVILLYPCLEQLVYSISGGNTEGKFYIDPALGNVMLISSLDYETTQSYSLQITIADKGSPAKSASGTITVTVTDINDKPPVCASSLYSATVAENSVSTSVVTVSCPDTETVGTVTYSITSGDASSYFSINTASGEISISSSAAINYETTQSYLLGITASDGVNSATTTVKVIVTDVNEYNPQFSPAGPFAATVSENSAIGTTVLTVSATDSDTFDTVKIYTITGGDTYSKFMIDSTTGVIKLQGLLDHETVGTYTLFLKVQDSGAQSSLTTLDVTVGDVNDNSPVCLNTPAVVAVDENVSPQTIYTPTCSDLDTAATPILVYSIQSGNNGVFTIDTATGAVSLQLGLDYETATSHQLVIHVDDQGSPAKTVTFNININVNPVNEFNPVFTSSGNYGPYNIVENTAIDTSVAQVSATDADKGLKQGTVYYSIIGGDAQGQFGIDQATGVLKVVKALDREAVASYVLTVRAKDDEPGSAAQRSVDATVSITVNDYNDNTPVFNPSVYTVDIIESAMYGPAVVLKTLTVQDDDAGINAATTITILSGNGESKFSISGKNLILSGQLDYEITKSYELVLEVTDGGTPSLKSAGRVIVNVLPDNDQAPLMTTASTTKSIPEDTSVGTLIFDADATDIDAGNDGKITYSIASGVSNYEFVIDSSTGELYVGSQLDYDTSPNTYSIIIKATDGAGASDASTSTVSLSIILTDVNDHWPQFALTMFNFNTKENVGVGTTVGTVVATDHDSGLNGALTYTKVLGNGFNYFDIDQTTGIVTTTDAIDYEAFKVFYLTVTAHDGGTPSLTSNGLVKITVLNMNDNDPVIVPVDFAVVMSESSVVGSSALSYATTDQDTKIDTYSLVTANSYFQINSVNGEVTTKAALDRETLASHILYIRIQDLSTSNDATIRSSTATLTVIVSDVNDNNPVITGTYTPSVSEDSSINTLVLTITATDPDANENAQLTYSITAGNTGNAFKIDSTGRVLINTVLDRETTASYTLTIVVRDKGSPPLSDQIDAIITITDVNDNTPIFSLAAYTFNINENSNTGTAVGTVTATDADAGVNAALTYSFDSFTTGTSSHFAISGSTGAITVASSALDRETMPTYVATVKVTDAGTPLSRTAYAQVTIYIDDLNDNAPVFGSSTYSASVDENSATTTSIVKVLATDADKNANAAITYSINSVLLDGTNANTYLKVDSATGVISPKTTIDYETFKLFTFVVTATDGGSPALSGTATVTITVVDVNDNNPIFSPVFYNAEIAYSGQCQSVITTVTATDADSGNNGLVSYSLQAAAYNYLFSVDSSTGKVSLSSVADTYTRYALDIQASDAGTTIRTSATPAKVRVDTYIPNNQVVTFRLKISRTSFLSQSATFLANLQTVVRNKYSTALVRLWCIQEYDGVAQLPAVGKRRLLGEQPVDVNLYVVKDDSSNSLGNINTEKEYLTQDEFLALVAANAEGDPGTSIQGTAWDYYKIVSVNPYYEESEGWFDTVYGKVITAIACLLGLILVGLLIYLIVRCCCGRGSGRKKKKRILSSRVVDVEPIKQPPPKKMVEVGWEPWKISDSTGGQPYRKAFPPMLITDPLSPPLTSQSSRSNTLNTPKSPRSLLITTNDEPSPPYSINNRAFEGRAMDPVTGKLYEYNTKTNERRWIE